MKTLLALAAAVALALSPLPASHADQETDATLTWTMNAEVQGRPFFGGVNYLSAGASDGTEATYRSTDRDVAILQRDATGATVPASWATRAAHLTGGGAQLVSLTGGTVTVAPDGGIDIRWTGAWSVNMYGGIAPYTLADPRLIVAPEGTGTLRADLSGYAGTIGSSAPATPVAPVADVAIATFSGVHVDTTAGFTVTPDFAGVAVTVPPGTTAQATSVAGWGSWPQPFVDFQQSTGLASYFYTSGTASTDPLKPPAPFGVGLGAAAPPIAPMKTPTPTPTVTPENTVVRPTVAGSLRWGVKSSFRSYVTGSIAKGAITVSSGAKSTDGIVAFGQESGGTFTLAKGTGTSRYDGAVRFTGHGGILDITMSDPIVQIASMHRATLSVLTGGHRVTIGTVSLPKGVERKGAISFSNAPVTLTAAGSSIFSYGGTAFYPAGTAMDPVTFTIGERATATSGAASLGAYRAWSAPATPPSRSGASVQGSPTAGSRVSVHASGFAPGERGIRVVLYSSPVVLGENLTADARGAVTAEVTLPSTLSGDHVLTVQGSVARGVPFTVEAAAAAAGCTVDSASLSWGFKESFRSYISGTIANGEWTPSGNASYATPDFTFANGTGVVDAEAATARLNFTGSIRFTGHDGALDLTIANPVYRQLDASTGELLVDLTSKPLDGGAEVAAKGVRFVTLALTGSEVTDAAATLTSEGAAAFAGFYKAGESFDPVSLTVSLPADCSPSTAAAAPTATATPEPRATGAATQRVDAASVSPTTPWVVSAVAIVLAVLALTLILIARRRVGSRG